MPSTALGTENLEMKRPQEVHNLLGDMDTLRINSEPVTVVAWQIKYPRAMCRKEELCWVWGLQDVVNVKESFKKR